MSVSFRIYLRRFNKILHLDIYFILYFIEYLSFAEEVRGVSLREKASFKNSRFFKPIIIIFRRFLSE